jgi:hypothetical protein
MLKRITALAGALAMVWCVAQAQGSSRVLIPHAAWDCGMPGGIPSPESGQLVFRVDIPLDRTANIGKTPFGERRVAVGKDGKVTGAKLTATVMPGALDYELQLANGTIEIEQLLVLKADDGGYLLVRNAGVGADAKDVRVVVDIEAPNSGKYAALNTGHFVARRELNAAARTLTLRVYAVTPPPANAANAIKVAKPAGVPAQPWNERRKEPGEKPGQMLIREDVALSPGQSVGMSKRGKRNIIPITGGELSGRITGKVLMGGADYQDLGPPVILVARYLWQTADGEIILVRNAGPLGALVPTFEARVDGPYAYLNRGRYLSADPVVGQGGVSITFHDSVN